MSGWVRECDADTEDRKQRDAARLAMLELEAENERLRDRIASYEARIAFINHEMAQLLPKETAA
jgi:hypothetical protein